MLSIFSLSLVCNFSVAQDLTGIWKGYFITDVGEQYKLEFQIKQDNPSSVTGVSYSYLDVRFYGKATMTGSMDKSEKTFQIQELRTVEVKNMGGGGTCLMKYIFTYDKSGKEEFLEGTFVGRVKTGKIQKIMVNGAVAEAARFICAEFKTPIFMLNHFCVINL